MQKMKIDDLISALSQLSVETGSLACLGCGHEHNCSTSGCAIIREAIKALRDAPWISVKDRLPEDRGNVLVVAFWHGRWVKQYRSGIPVDKGYVSSCCDMWSDRKSNYCPNCGAKMDADG